MPKKTTKKKTSTRKKSTKKKSTRKPDAEQGNDTDVLDLLAGLGADYHTDATDGEFDDMPDNDYPVAIDDIVVGESKSSQRLQISFETTVTGGDYQNRKIFLHLGLDSKENIGRTKGQLKTLEYEFPEDPKDLPADIQSLIGIDAIVTLKTSRSSGGQWRTFTGLSDDGGAVAESEPDPTSEDSSGEIVKGARVYSDEYGPDELGMVTAKAKDGTITIEYDDATVGKYPVEEVHLVEGEAAAEEEPAKVTIEFDDDAITAQQETAIETLAKAAEYDPDKYEKWCDLLADLGEEYGVDGTFANAKSLILAVKKAAK